jgi:hypothetical protein
MLLGGTSLAAFLAVFSTISHNDIICSSEAHQHRQTDSNNPLNISPLTSREEHCLGHNGSSTRNQKMTNNQNLKDSTAPFSCKNDTNISAPSASPTSNNYDIHNQNDDNYVCYNDDDKSLLLDLPNLAPLTDTSIPIPIEHKDMSESTSVLLSGEPMGNETLEHQIEQFDEGIPEDIVTESDYELLQRITTIVGDYHPLEHEKPEKFIPVLEARGLHDNDKDEFGHRRDTLPIANALDQYSEIKTHSAVFQFLEENDGENKVAVRSNLALKRFLAMNAQGVIVRNNPGTLSALSQKNFDDMLRELSDTGLMIMTHPDVMSTLGAKDVSFL